MLIQVFHLVEDTQASPYCTLGVIFVRQGVAKVDQESITQELGTMSFVALYHLSTSGLIGTDNWAILFGAELAGELCRVHEVAEHHGELAAFGLGCTLGLDRRCFFDRCGGLGCRRWDRLRRRIKGFGG